MTYSVIKFSWLIASYGRELKGSPCLPYYEPMASIHLTDEKYAP